MKETVKSSIQQQVLFGTNNVRKHDRKLQDGIINNFCNFQNTPTYLQQAPFELASTYLSSQHTHGTRNAYNIQEVNGNNLTIDLTDPSS